MPSGGTRLSPVRTGRPGGSRLCWGSGPVGAASGTTVKLSVRFRAASWCRPAPPPTFPPSRCSPSRSGGPVRAARARLDADGPGRLPARCAGPARRRWSSCPAAPLPRRPAARCPGRPARCRWRPRPAVLLRRDGGVPAREGLAQPDRLGQGRTEAGGGGDAPARVYVHRFHHRPGPPTALVPYPPRPTPPGSAPPRSVRSSPSGSVSLRQLSLPAGPRKPRPSGSRLPRPAGTYRWRSRRPGPDRPRAAGTADVSVCPSVG
ncbi:hypothetical protein SUDANB99_05887 [Streptomyces sp. enrichment culture]